MTCSVYQELASQFIDGELTDNQSGELFSHLGNCSRCRQFMHSALQVRATIMHSPAFPFPPTLDERVSRIRIRRSPARVPFRVKVKGFWKQRLAVPVPAFLSAGVMLLVAVAISIITLTKVPRESQDAMSKTMYLVTLPAVEVQGTYPVNENKVR